MYHVSGLLKVHYAIAGSKQWGKETIGSSLKKQRQIYVKRNWTSKEKEWEPTQTEAIAALRFNCLKWGAFPTTFHVFFFPFFFSLLLLVSPCSISGFYQRYTNTSSTSKVVWDVRGQAGFLSRRYCGHSLHHASHALLWVMALWTCTCLNFSSLASRAAVLTS